MQPWIYPPPIGPNPYNNILTNLCEKSVKLADELMCQSGIRLFDIGGTGQY